MSSTNQAQLDAAQIGNLPDLCRMTKLGKAMGLLPVTEKLAVASHIATPTVPARAILRCFASVGGSTGDKAPVASETTPGAGECAVNEDGNLQFAAADAVTECEVTYIPLEGELVTETIQVTAGGVGTFLNSKRAIQIVSATLLSPAATPGAKTPEARGTLEAALSGSGCAVMAAGTTIQFKAAEAASACTALVTYYAMLGEGTGVEEPLVERLRDSFTP